MALIILDPGHGGRDPGAAGNGLTEKDLTMFLSVRVEERLDSYHCRCEIYQDPNADGRQDLEGPVEYAGRAGADLLVSIHVNASENPGAAGFESFRHISSPPAVEEMQRALHLPVAEFCARNGIRDRGIKVADFFVLREAAMPAVLLECGFLSSPGDAEKLGSMRFLDKLANEIAWGVARGLGLKPRRRLSYKSKQ